MREGRVRAAAVTPGGHRRFATAELLETLRAARTFPDGYELERLLMAEETPPVSPHRRRGDRGQLAWSVVLNAILVAAFVLGAIPFVAIVRGLVEAVSQSKIRSGADWFAYGFAFTGLFLGAIFFAYAIKYYLSTAMVLLTTLVTTPRNGNGHGSKGSPNLTGHNRINGNGNGNGNGSISTSGTTRLSRCMSPPTTKSA